MLFVVGFNVSKGAGASGDNNGTIARLDNLSTGSNLKFVGNGKVVYVQGLPGATGAGAVTSSTNVSNVATGNNSDMTIIKFK